MHKTHPAPDVFAQLSKTADLVPMYRRLMSDQITPVLGYRRLVRDDDRMAPSFLFESVVDGQRIGRYSFLGAQPIAEYIAYDRDVTYIDHRRGETQQYSAEDPLADLAAKSVDTMLASVPGLPTFTGGWVGFAGYDTVRYLEGEKLTSPPTDDRKLPDMHMQLYRQIVAFDSVQKGVLVITNVRVDEYESVDAAYDAGATELDALVERLETPMDRAPELPAGAIDLETPPPAMPLSNMGQGGYQDAVRRCKEYIAAGDIFQVVPSQRFDIDTTADPFDIYRALRVVNPSPYMFYLQVRGGILIGSSPEILCRVADGKVINRPLAGTRRRGKDEAEDRALENDLLSDPKEIAEHVMLVDLGRNDVGRVAQPGSIELPEVLAIERYSHVMHISSTVTGTMQPGTSSWDALRVILPVGTVSGAPKVRAMQIIDELEPTRRGPYAGAVGHVDYSGNMDMAIALRTIVAMPGQASGRWAVHLQAGAGIVADSDPDAEHVETVNKAAALAKAVHLAETAFEGGTEGD